MKVYTQTNTPITLMYELGKGGEASIYDLADYPNWVAKIYHQPTPQQEAKLQAMLTTPPEQPQTHIAVAWPTDLLYTDRQFSGFLMPKISNSNLIFNVYNPVRRKQIYPQFTPYHLHLVAYNLAVATHTIHSIGHVIGDLNESNILVSPETLVTLVDTDSFQITDAQGLIYRCPVGKPEYTPPELQGVDLKTVNQTIEHDLFGLGVLLFQLLMGGFHPFTGVLNSNFSVERVDLYAIQQGWFPYGQTDALIPPPTAPPFTLLHPTLQHAFEQCFAGGFHEPTQRPTAWQWLQLLDEAIKLLVTCPRQPEHVYSSHWDDCPYCYDSRLIVKPNLPKQQPVTASVQQPANYSHKPHNFKVYQTNDELLIKYQPFDRYNLQGDIFIVLGNFVILVGLIFLFTMLMTGDIVGGLGLGFLVGGGFLFFMVSVGILLWFGGSKQIKVTKEKIAVQSNNLWPFIDEKIFFTTYVDQIYSKQDWVYVQGRYTTLYPVRIISRVTGLEHQLMMFRKPEYARFVELTIKQFLNLPDSPTR